MSSGFLAILYLTAAILFIVSIAGLSRQHTARQGNLLGAIGMGVAIVATLLNPAVVAFQLPLLAVLIGAALGAGLALRVAMTAMPEMVALLNSFVGLAAVLVGLSSYIGPIGEYSVAEQTVHLVEIWLGVAIGALTFTGSVVSWAKLRGSLSGAPVLLSNRHALNAGGLGLLIVLMFALLFSGVSLGVAILIIVALIAGAMGVHLVMAIGGADMPVVVSVLNSYSGWAAALAGFMLRNDLLIVTGALVGSSGAILSYIMCKAMNRSIWNVIFGGFGTADNKPVVAVDDAARGEAQAIDPDGVADLLKDARDVIVVPGYGMAVARAQQAVEQMTRALKGRNIRIRYAIHPVAGRLPGHMNVLLAEAGVPYDIVLEMDEINDDMPRTDVVMVVGANDIVNPAAETMPGSDIYGMPVLQVWKARHVIVLKRSLGSGYAGVQNPLFFYDNTRMFFGDARENIEKLNAALS
ncbi:MAG: NAD(P)(+) transhydrogenase (Re/Si-specific) subunit beta [Myxococcota bacterium]